MLEELLPPVNISVYTEFPLMSEPPEADILLLRRKHPAWTTEQRNLLPDGIRDSQARHILLEFKYTESINEEAFLQSLGYDTFYKRSKQLTSQEVQTFLLSAKKTQRENLVKFGYQPTALSGVYQSQNWPLTKIPLLSLNELSNEAHNAFFKCFASRKQEKLRAFNTLKNAYLGFMTEKLKWFLAGLWEYWFEAEEQDMTTELTTEQLIEMGKMWGEFYLSNLPAEKRLAGLTPKDRLAGLKLEEIEEYLHQLKQKDSK